LPPKAGSLFVQCDRDLFAVPKLMLEIAPHVRGKSRIFDPKHDLEVDVEAAEVEVRGPDVHEVVHHCQLGVKLGRLILEHLNASPE